MAWYDYLADYGRDTSLSAVGPANRQCLMQSEQLHRAIIRACSGQVPMCPLQHGLTITRGSSEFLNLTW